MLAEDSIKRSALRYLKGYYKHRPRSGDTSGRLDQRAEGGIIADVFVSFPKEDGRVFTATAEATSHLTKSEIVFQVMRSLLYWDAATFAVVFTTIFFTLSHVYNWFTVDQYGTWPSLGIIWISALFFFLLYYLLFRGLQRYRYIYAVEQFKRYHADEQWIAFGEDVFSRPQNKYLDELRHQCIKYGFGLLRVKEDGECIPLITPSRHELFSGRRQLRQFISQRKWTNTLADRGANIWGRFRQRLNQLNPAGLSQDRFQRTYYNQMAIIGLCLIALGAIFYTEYQKASRVYVDQREFRALIDSIRVSGIEEPEFYVVDTPFLKDPFPIHSLPAPEYKDDRKKEKPLPEEPEPDPEPFEIPEEEVVEAIAEPDTAALILDGAERILIPDCARIINLEGENFLLVEGSYPTFTSGISRLESLSELLPEGGLLNMGCFVPGRTDFALFAGLIFNDRKEAEAYKAASEQRIRASGRSGIILSVFSLSGDLQAE